jgi:hypothetical protein
MREFGNAIAIQLMTDGSPPAEIVEQARAMLEFNYRRTREEHPDRGLPESGWEFIANRLPPQPVYETVACPICRGEGGTPEFTCVSCGGYGLVTTGRLADPPRWLHTFGWYICLEG